MTKKKEKERDTLVGELFDQSVEKRGEIEVLLKRIALEHSECITAVASDYQGNVKDLEREMGAHPELLFQESRKLGWKGFLAVAETLCKYVPAGELFLTVYTKHRALTDEAGKEVNDSFNSLVAKFPAVSVSYHEVRLDMFRYNRFHPTRTRDLRIYLGKPRFGFEVFPEWKGCSADQNYYDWATVGNAGVIEAPEVHETDVPKVLGKFLVQLCKERELLETLRVNGRIVEGYDLPLMEKSILYRIRGIASEE